MSSRPSQGPRWRVTGPWLAEHTPGEVLELRAMPDAWAYAEMTVGAGLCALGGITLIGGELAGALVAGVLGLLVIAHGAYKGLGALRERARFIGGDGLRGPHGALAWSEIAGAHARVHRELRRHGLRVRPVSVVLVSVAQRGPAGLVARDVFRADDGLTSGSGVALVEQINGALRGLGLSWSSEAEAAFMAAHPAPEPSSQLPLGYAQLLKLSGYDLEVHRQELSRSANALGLGVGPTGLGGGPTLQGSVGPSRVRVDWAGTSVLDTTTRVAVFLSRAVGEHVNQDPQVRAQIAEAQRFGARVDVATDSVTYVVAGRQAEPALLRPLLSHAVGLAQTLEAR